MQADAAVVGARPAGSSTAHYLAMAGLRVLFLEKLTFSWNKAREDGLTPRVVAELVRMGVGTSGQTHNTGLRAVGGGRTIKLPWSGTVSLSSFGLACPCAELDATLAAEAQESGAVLRENVTVVGPILRERSDKVVGVKAKSTKCEPLAFKALVVADAGRVSARLATAVRRGETMNRPMGVTYRTHFRSRCSANSVMESHLELWGGKPGKSDLMPGYGWIFPLVGGIINVGLESLSSTTKAMGLDYRAIFKAWMANTPPEWGFARENQVDRLHSAVLPMAFNRRSHYTDGLLLVGDADDMVSPFSREGIVYTFQVGCLTVDIIAQAHSRLAITAEGGVLTTYSAVMREELGGYYSLGRASARLIERPWIMHMCVAHDLSRPTLVRLAMRLFSDCYDRHGGGWIGRLILALTKAVSKARRRPRR